MSSEHLLLNPLLIVGERVPLCHGEDGKPLSQEAPEANMSTMVYRGANEHDVTSLSLLSTGMTRLAEAYTKTASNEEHL